MSRRASLVADVEAALGNRRLVWAGLRGDDIQPLTDLPQLYASFSIVGNGPATGIPTVAYEDLVGQRMDPEIWDIDDHLDIAPTREFRRGLLRALGSASALLPYRPSQFLSAVQFARQRTCIQLGLFGAHQSAFEHKPWVESSVAALGVPHIPWTYIADEEQLTARELSRKGTIVLRRSRTSGGQGFTLIEGPEHLAAAWPDVDEAFVSVAPYLSGGLSLNIGATVWPDGVTLHHPSVQLIGEPSLVTRTFGYCGNDFAAVRDLGPEVIDQLETSTRRIAGWLQHHGYLGTVGVDYLLHEGQVLFTEINPRFQGSTRASGRLAVDSDQPCLMLEHVAAWLGLPCPEPRPLQALVDETPPFAQLAVHWLGHDIRTVDAYDLADRIRAVEPTARADSLVPASIASEPGSLVGRFSVRRGVLTGTGTGLDPALDAAIAGWHQASAA